MSQLGLGLDFGRDDKPLSGRTSEADRYVLVRADSIGRASATAKSEKAETGKTYGPPCAGVTLAGNSDAKKSNNTESLAPVPEWGKKDGCYVEPVVKDPISIERTLGRRLTDEERLEVLKSNPRLRGFGKGRSKGKEKTVKVRMWYTNSAASAAGAALVATTAVNLTAYQDWASFAAVYDRVKVVGGVMHWRIFDSVSVQSLQDSVCVYDPIDATALASAVNALTYEQHDGPKHCNNGIVNTPECVNPSGFFSFRWRVPKGPTRNTSSAAIVEDEWMSTTDGGDLWGYHKWFTSAGSATEVHNLVYFSAVDVLFRTRV